MIHTDNLSDRDLLVMAVTKLDGVVTTQQDHEQRIRLLEDAEKGTSIIVDSVKWMAPLLIAVAAILSNHYL